HAEPSDIDEIDRIARENEVEAIIVGLPRSLSGQLGSQAKLVKTFVTELSARVDLPVTMVDERYTTVQAERMLRESGRQPSRDRGLVDASAAAVMLQAYLDARR
ncbi:MAG: Holliday junction resolvase RuvX, partial [SAR202 cluster bacterium]|nr:Holliday junction resolvase RuvX [SAR202 cluster bacterium]